MRFILHLKPRRKTEYQNDYNHNVRGILYNLLDEEYPDLHGDHKAIPFTFSNLFPPGQFLSDDTKIIVASHSKDYLAEIINGLSDKSELNIGEMPFWIDDISAFNVKPKDSGTLISEHGVYCSVNSDRENPTYWRKQQHGVSTFKKRIEESLDWKIDEFTPYNSDKRDFPVFDNLELKDTFARPVTVESNSKITVILSNWEFEYRIRSNMHRRYIQLALDSGLGWKNTLGFGFVNEK